MIFSSLLFPHQDYEGAKYDVASCLFLEPNSRSVMSLFARLFPEKSMENVLQSPTGVLAAQLVERSIKEAFPTPWLCHEESRGIILCCSLNVCCSSSLRGRSWVYLFPVVLIKSSRTCTYNRIPTFCSWRSLFPFVVYLSYIPPFLFSCRE